MLKLAEFRKLLEGFDDMGKAVALEDNWRPTQPLHDREVEVSFPIQPAYEVVKEKENLKSVAGDENEDNAALSVHATLGVTALLCFVFIQLVFHWSQETFLQSYFNFF